MRQRKLRRALSSCALVGVALLAMGATPSAAQAAQSLPTDGAVVAGTFTQVGGGSDGTWSDQGVLTFYIHNYGPNDLPPAGWWLEYVAAAGTEFATPERYFADCIEIVAGTDYKCSGGQEFVDDPANYEGTCCNRVDIHITIVGTVTSPARVTLTYSADTNTANNSATLAVHPHVVTPPASPTPSKAAPHASPSASRVRPALPGAAGGTALPGQTGAAGGATGLPAASAGQPGASSDPLRLASGSRSGGGSAALWIAIAVLLLGAAGTTAVVLRRRGRGSAQNPAEDDAGAFLQDDGRVE